MTEPASPLLRDTDKASWHGYVDFYETVLPGEIDGLIVEFGVLHGQSIRWLASRYPRAAVIGVDILSQQPEWPVDVRISYSRVDQGHEDQVRAFFAGTERPALVIEDGSHIPAHQARCLRHGLHRLQAGGTYVVEDIHTSHPAHPYFRQEFGSRLRRVLTHRPAPQTVLSVLLALEHKRRGGEPVLSDATVEQLAGAQFDADEIRAFDDAIAEVKVFRRPTLPSRCYRCGRSDFDYHDYRCRCGTALLAEADSMCAVIRKRV